MKKLTKLFVVAAVVLAGFMMSGCDLLGMLKDQVASTYNTWYKYTGTIPSIPVANAADADADVDKSTGAFKDAEIYVYFDEDDGLTLAIQSTSEQNISLLGGLASTVTKVTTGGTKQYPISEFGKIKWAGLVSSGSFEESKKPAVATKPTPAGVILLTDPEANVFNFQWKKVLKEILIEQLLGDI